MAADPAGDPCTPQDSLRLLVCGGADDGESTLLARLLRDLGAVSADEADGVRAGAELQQPGPDADDSPPLDGLAAGPGQAITNDLDWRPFSIAGRRYLVADAPGRELDMHTLVGGAATADAVLLLVGARHGLLPSTRRHLVICSLMGIRHVALAIDETDLNGRQQPGFGSLAAEASAFAARAGLGSLCCVRTCSLSGDNASRRAVAAHRHHGPTLREWLEGLPPRQVDGAVQPARLPVQTVLGGAEGARWIAGRLVAGTMAAGDRVRVLPSGQVRTVQSIRPSATALGEATDGQPVAVQLAPPLDVAPGDVLCHEHAPTEAASQFQASIVWLHETPLLRGRSYRLQLGTAWAVATVSPVRHRMDTDTLQAVPAERLERHQIGEVELELDRPVAFEPYASNRALGGFILADLVDGQTVGAGTLRFALRRSGNLRWQPMEVDRTARQQLKGHRSAVLWLTGLSGAGKSTLADRLEQRLHALGVHTHVLDGDNVRQGLCKDLGFTDQDRVENIRRVAEVARLMVDAGLLVITALISPFVADRAMARALFAPGEFLEVHVDVTLALAEQRDPKGLYRKARSGQLRNFTGIDSPYEPPAQPELRIDTAACTPTEAVDALLALLRERGLLPR